MTTNEPISIGIDASRNRSGGARAHLIGIISESDPREFGIREVHIWAYQSLLDAIPDQPWLIKHRPVALEKSLARQLWWQATALAGELRRAGCQLLFSTDASTLCSFRPHIVMSQDLLSFEPGMMSAYGLTGARLRLETILFLQKWAMQRAAGVIFLTKYAGDLVMRITGRLGNIAHIPHGVGPEFTAVSQESKRANLEGGKIRCLYVSNAELYKNHPQVVAAVAQLVAAGHDIVLTLVGGGVGKGLERLNEAITQHDPERKFVKAFGFVQQADLPRFLRDADIFIFASTCENLPVTLLEAMAAGLPVACSDRGPMPEVLGDAGIFFDPARPAAIRDAVETLIINDAVRRSVAESAQKVARQYTWRRCGDSTWSFIVNTYERRLELGPTWKENGASRREY
jgi:glycosyltransferase involved in cell wall biosynthesis